MLRPPRPRLLSLLFLPAALLVGLVPLVEAQKSDATCPSNLAFLNGPNGDTPCELLSSIFGVCSGRFPDFTLTALGDRFSGYAGPTSTDPGSFNMNRCLCSMPTYNLVMACETCQGKTVIPFSQFTASCNSSFTGAQGYPILELPVTMPTSVVFPTWVNIDNRNHQWSTAEATVAATTSSSSSSSSHSSTTTTGSSMRTTSGTSPTTTSDDGAAKSNDSGSGKKDNTGAIVGGTVGGIALLGIIGLGALYLIRTNKNHHSAYSRSITNWQQDSAPSPFHSAGSAASTGSHRAPSASWYGRPMQENPPLSPRGVTPSMIDYAPRPAQTPMVGRQYSGHHDPGMWGAATPAPPMPPMQHGGGGYVPSERSRDSRAYPSPHSPNNAYGGMFAGHAEVQEERSW